MPISATAARANVAVMMEASPGEQLLLASTPVIATIAGFTTPTGSTGMRLHLKISNWTTSGTVTITGVGTPANTETYSIAAPTAQQTQSAQLANNEYVSVNAYTSITNVTTTGLTNGVIVAYGIQAGKYQMPCAMTSNRTPKQYSPNLHNSLISRHTKVLHLVNDTVFDVKQDAYDEISLWWMYMTFGAPVTTTTLPAVPTSLFPSTVLAATQSLTTQPTSPGMKLIITISAFTVPGTLAITGTVNGITGVTETISITAAGTYYSSNVYSAVQASGLVNTSIVATMVITGVIGWQLTFNSEGNLYSAAIEWFDGTGSFIHPFAFATDSTFDAKVATEISLNCKGKAQDKLPIGDRTVTPLAGVNRISSPGVNLSDMPIVGWQAAIWLDAITGTPQTTVYGDLQELKVDFKIPQQEHWTFTNTQNFNRCYPGKRECAVEMTLDFRDVLQWEQFRQNLKQYLVTQFYGQGIGTIAAVPYYKSWTWTFPIKPETFDPTSDPTKGNVTCKAKWMCEYDSVLASEYRLVVVTQQPPVYTV